MENILEYLESNRLSELKNILNEEKPCRHCRTF